MKGRLEFEGETLIMNLGNYWPDKVTKPRKEGYIQEAFASADALIDEEVEWRLRQIYSKKECQDLIGELNFQRGRVNFDGIVMLEILKYKGLIDDGFMQKVRKFKKARNLVLHNKYAEYALVIGNQNKKYSTQEELDELVNKEVDLWLNEALEIFDKLFDLTYEISKDIETDPNFYFSADFYKKHPRGELAQRRYPKQGSKPKKSKKHGTKNIRSN